MSFSVNIWFSSVTANGEFVLSCRSLAPTAAKKRKITQRIMSLAVEHQFVTPLTALLVESEDATERLLADSPRDPKHGCCSGA